MWAHIHWCATVFFCIRRACSWESSLLDVSPLNTPLFLEQAPISVISGLWNSNNSHRSEAQVLITRPAEGDEQGFIWSPKTPSVCPAVCCHKYSASHTCTGTLRLLCVQLHLVLQCVPEKELSKVETTFLLVLIVSFAISPHLFVFSDFFSK